MQALAAANANSATPLQSACVLKRTVLPECQTASRSQTEYVQHRRGRLVLQLGCILDDERPHARSYQNRNVLLAVDRVADRRRLNWAADVEAPHLVQGLGVIGRE